MNDKSRAHAATLAVTPLLACITRRGGMVRMRVDRDDRGAIRLTLGPGYAASFSELGSERKAREVAVSMARSTCARVTSDLKIVGSSVARDLVTEFARGTVRRDNISFDGRKVGRSVSWTLAGGNSATAIYSEWERRLRLTKNGRDVGSLLTNGGPIPSGWRSSTSSFFMPFDPREYGAGFAADAPTSGTSNANVLDIGFGSTRTSFGATSPDGSVTVSFTHGAGSAGAMGTTGRSDHDHLEIVGRDGFYLGDQFTNDHSDGTTQVITYWESGLNPGGTVASGMSTFTKDPVTGNIEANGKWQKKVDNGENVGTWNAKVNSDGSSSGTFTTNKPDGSTATFGWTRDKDGTTTTYTEVGKPDGSGSRSATADDGKGNQSTSSVETHSDGSFTITTVSKGSDGSTSKDSKDYDKNGDEKPAPPSGTGGDTQGGEPPPPHDDGGEDGLPADDGSGSIPTPNTINAMAGYTETPSGDGSDPEPQPDVAGPGTAAFQGWLAHGSPFLGGRSSSGSSFHGNPIDRIIAAVNDEGDGDGTGQGNGDDSGVRIDLRAILMEEQDPEHNPKALFEVLARFSGIAGSSASMHAADKVVRRIAT